MVLNTNKVVRYNKSCRLWLLVSWEHYRCQNTNWAVNDATVLNVLSSISAKHKSFFWNYKAVCLKTYHAHSFSLCRCVSEMTVEMDFQRLLLRWAHFTLLHLRNFNSSSFSACAPPVTVQIFVFIRLLNCCMNKTPVILVAEQLKVCRLQSAFFLALFLASSRISGASFNLSTFEYLYFVNSFFFCCFATSACQFRAFYLIFI